MNLLNHHARYYYSNLTDEEKDSRRLSNLSEVTYPINVRVWLKPTFDFKAQEPSLHHTILSNTPKNWPERKRKLDMMKCFISCSDTLRPFSAVEMTQWQHHSTVILSYSSVNSSIAVMWDCSAPSKLPLFLLFGL